MRGGGEEETTKKFNKYDFLSGVKNKWVLFIEGKYDIFKMSEEHYPGPLTNQFNFSQWRHKVSDSEALE